MKRKKFGALQACSLVGVLLWSGFSEAVPTSDEVNQTPMDKAANADVLDQAERMAEAKQRFDRGLELYNDGDPGLALIEFNRAYKLVPNYRVLYNIGQVGIQLAQYANARRALERYLKEAGGGLSAERQQAVAADLVMLSGRTAFLTVRSGVVGAEVLVDEIVMGTTPLIVPLLVDAGVHRVVLRLSGHDAQARRVTLAGGDDIELAPPLVKRVTAAPVIVMQDVPNEGQRRKNLIVVGWVATGALTAGALVTGIMGWGEKTENAELLLKTPEEVEGLGQKLLDSQANGNSLFLASDVLTASALVAGGLSLWLSLNSDNSSSVEDTASFPIQNLKMGYSRGQLKLHGSF